MYIDLPTELPYSLRARGLQETWGFSCTCSLCSASLSERTESDERRVQFHAIRRAISRKTYQSYEELLDLTKEWLYVIKTERLEIKIPDYYRFLMEAYAEAEDFRRAISYGKKALKFEQAVGDIETQFYEDVSKDLRLLEELRQFSE